MESEETAGEQNGRGYEELRLLYQVSTLDIRFFKEQQWKVTNYGLVLYGVIFGVAQTEGNKIEILGRVILCAVAAAIFGFGVYVLCKLEESIRIHRGRTERIKEKFTALFKEVVVGESSKIAEISSLLFFVLLVGLVFTWWFVLREFLSPSLRPLCSGLGL
jgi:hypothetical protein